MLHFRLAFAFMILTGRLMAQENSAQRVKPSIQLKEGSFETRGNVVDPESIEHNAGLKISVHSTQLKSNETQLFKLGISLDLDYVTARTPEDAVPVLHADRTLHLRLISLWAEACSNTQLALCAGIPTYSNLRIRQSDPERPVSLNLYSSSVPFLLGAYYSYGHLRAGVQGNIGYWSFDTVQGKGSLQIVQQQFTLGFLF
ncbi:MAG TPA: hypothetical protein VE954_07770 [Oligoflexus sp.]|uniref:hypothetical protein n=1 Tax=Oligoflexus sp. TaxID=1971216 RepID=UPI002D542C47|nr:hypothetical protein [Oligoflexus sp.]HYX32998.1 hypothetical protein [Oligoflexus sp.]